MMEAVNTDSQKQSPTVSQLGKVVPLEGGRAMVEFERYLQHSPQRVWTALTDPAELARWIPEIRLEPKLGGRYALDFSGGNSDCEGGPAVIEGKISEFEPDKILACGSMRWELRAEGQGCVLRFTDILNYDQPLDKETIEQSVLEGWSEYLDRLENALSLD